MKHHAVALVAVVMAGTLSAQEHYTKHNFSIAMGSAQPRGELRNLYKDSFALGVGYGYRFHPYFQADIALDNVFGAAGVRDFLPTEFGDLRIRDYQHMLAMGGRAILPLADDRVLIYGGGGGAYLRYSERLRQPSDYFTIDCNVCTSRDGWGYYGLVGASVALDSGRHFRIGVTSRVYRGHTDGDPLGAVPPRRTTDRWVNILGEFTISF